MKKFTKLIITTIIFLFWTINVFACESEEEWHAKLFAYLAEVWDGYNIDTFNEIRKPYVLCAHPDDDYAEHRITALDISWLWDGYIEIFCVNNWWKWFTIEAPVVCDNYEWQCHWEDCIEDWDWVDCKNTCTQKYVCEKVKTANTACPGWTIWTDETKSVKKDLTQSGCSQVATCWEINWYRFSASDLAWPSWTDFCWLGNSSPTTPSFPWLGSSSTWTCHYVSDWESSSAWCSASRGKTWWWGDWTSTSCWDWEIQTPNDDGISEDCDDWNQNDTDSCSNDCQITTPPSVDPTYCWDWEENWSEVCDDWNNLSWDWCSSTCTFEPGGWYCWDWFVQNPNDDWIDEVCDDNNNNSDDWCTNSCQLPHTSHPWDKTYCWNWKVDSPNYFWFAEECDDGNTNSDDLCTNNCTLPHNSLPWEIKVGTTSKCDLSKNLWYANNVEENIVYATITVENWVEDNKDVINFGTPTNFVDLSNNVSDRVYNKWKSSLSFEWIEVNWIPWNWNSQTVPIAKVKSITPFASCWNKLSFNLWWQTVVLKDVWYNFKKPFIWELTSTWNISLWTKLKYKLTAVPVSTYSNYALSLKINNIAYSWANITLQNTKLMSYTWIWARYFETRINSSNYATKLNNQPAVQVILPVISYKAWNGQIVRYYLSAYDYGNDRTPITLQWEKFIGVKIIWWLQWAWKYEFTWQWKNISNLYPGNLRAEIRKRAYDYIKNMTSDTIINKVKYVNWDITISWEQDYETLVVKNGNVIISWDLNDSNKKLWIIVLKDSYDVVKWYNDKWNVLVKSDVTKVNAMIYADWWFISAKDDGTIYYPDSPERTYALQRQLTMNWTLFTRNTIGWAQYVGWYYTLPGWTRTLSYDKSMVYDLNYIRRWNIWCEDLNLDWDCEDSSDWEIKEWFIIKYDSRIQTNPPKLFSK